MLKLQDLATRPDLNLGSLSVSPSRRLIRGPGGEANVEPLTMQVFLLLIDAAGSVVTRKELFDQCWGGVMVGDDSLNRAIGAVRRVGAKVAPGYFEVETIPRTGYRLTGEMLNPPAGEPGEQPKERTQLVSRRGLVIGGGATAVGLASLAAWSAFRPRTDPRFTALVEEADQVLRYEYSERRLSAVRLLDQALMIQPGNAGALGLLAYARSLRATNDGAQNLEDVQTAQKALRTALAADSQDPHAHLALLLFRQGGLDWAATEDELRSILRTAPRNQIVLSRLGALYHASGRLGLSLNIVETLIAMDPLSPSLRFRRALQLWIFGRTGEADRVIDRTIQIWPRHPWVWNARFLILAFTGRAHAALDMIDDAATRPSTITPDRMAQWHPTLEALERPDPATVSAARDANLKAARESPGQAAYAVMALGGIGEIDAAYDVAEGFLLSKGAIVTRRPSDHPNMLVNTPAWRQTHWLATPPLTGFRADPRFDRLCDGIGLTEYWRKRGIEPDYPRAPNP